MDEDSIFEIWSMHQNAIIETEYSNNDSQLTESELAVLLVWDAQNG